MMGVYSITNLKSGKRYIGSSTNPNRRWVFHKRDLESNSHVNPHLQNAWNKNKQENFTFEVLEEVSDSNLLVSVEQKWLDCTTNKYNVNLLAYRPPNQLGKKRSKETKLSTAIRVKMSLIAKQKGFGKWNKRRQD